jgi:pyruvate dehydrogenase E2 component (dihydrolipoamide acetyltransferase)
MKTVEMPKMGDTMEEGKILRWIKHEGDAVKKGESLAEVETDKVNIEIEAFASGVLRKILVPEGDSAPIGSGIALIGAADEPLPEGLSGNAKAQAAAPSPTTQQAQATRPATQNSTAVVEDVPAAYDAEAQGRIFISPLARRFAEERSIDYTHIRGTGPNGRIIKLDVETALAQPAPEVGTRAAQAPPPATATTPAPAYVLVSEPLPAAVDTGEVVEIPLTAMRRTIARRLSQSMQTAPHFYVTSVIDTGKLGELRKQINAYAASDPSPVKVSFNDLIIKAVARSLVKMPQVNVSFADDKLLQKKSVHVGMAVALEQGLIVPVIHNAERTGILDIAREAQRLAEAARSGKLRPEEFAGGTFTVSNLGMFDVDSFTAVINPPESAILAVGSITPTPVVVDGQVVVRDRMKVTLSSDHRAIDGATAARFLQEVKRLLEEPFGLLL